MSIKKIRTDEVPSKKPTIANNISSGSEEMELAESKLFVVKPHRKSRVSKVANSRKYAVSRVSEAKIIASGWLKSLKLENVIGFGLPEIDDRYHIWRVPLVNMGSSERIGEIVIDAYTSLVDREETSTAEVLEARILGRSEKTSPSETGTDHPSPVPVSYVRNTVICR